MLNLTVLLCAKVFFAGCAEENSSSNDSSTNAIFGADNRKAIAPSFIERRVGKLGTCTGTMIERRLVLTAAHCVLDKNDHVKPDLSFCAGYIGDVLGGPATCVAKSRVVASWLGDKTAGSVGRVSSGDFAIVALQEPLGERLGWFGIGFSRVEDIIGKRVNMVSYSSDRDMGKTQMLQTCSIRDRASSGLLQHDCDSWPGTSGAALFVQDENGKRFVIGNHSGGPRKRYNAYTSANGNSAVPVSKFKAQFEAARAKFP